MKIEIPLHTVVLTYGVDGMKLEIRPSDLTQRTVAELQQIIGAQHYIAEAIEIIRTRWNGLMADIAIEDAAESRSLNTTGGAA